MRPCDPGQIPSLGAFRNLMRLELSYNEVRVGGARALAHLRGAGGLTIGRCRAGRIRRWLLWNEDGSTGTEPRPLCDRVQIRSLKPLTELAEAPLTEMFAAANKVRTLSTYLHPPPHTHTHTVLLGCMAVQTHAAGDTVLRRASCAGGAADHLAGGHRGADEAGGAGGRL